MNPREKWARLGPSTVKFDIGMGGGKPDLTNQDIAAALGMVPAGLGRELLEACWWPDGAALRRHKLRDAVIALVTPELQRQQRRSSGSRRLEPRRPPKETKPRARDPMKVWVGAGRGQLFRSRI